MQRANAHCWARAFEWVGNARDARSLRGTCGRGVMGFDVAVQGGWIALAAHRGRGEEEDAGATCMYVRGWFPVELRECKGLEGKGCIVRLEHALPYPFPASGGYALEHLVVCETVAAPSCGDSPRVIASPALRDAQPSERLEFRLTSTPHAPRRWALQDGLLASACDSVRVLDFSRAPDVVGDPGTHFLSTNYAVEEVVLPNFDVMPPFFLHAAEVVTAVDLSQMTRTESIGAECFKQCPALPALDFRAMRSLRHVGNAVASECTTLTAVDVSKLPLLEEIEGCFLFSNAALTSVDMHGLGKLTAIGNYCLCRCPALTRIDLSGCGELRSIPMSLGFGASALTSISLSGLESVAEVHSNFLNGASSLRSIDLAGLSHVKRIRDGFLRRCTALEHVDLSPLKKLESIGYATLSECSALRSLTMDGLACLRSVGPSLCFDSVQLENASLRGLTQLEAVTHSWFRGALRLQRVDLSEGSTSAVVDITEEFLSGRAEERPALVVHGATGVVAKHLTALKGVVQVP